jgi:hypothetical protein
MGLGAGANTGVPGKHPSWNQRAPSLGLVVDIEIVVYPHEPSRRLVVYTAEPDFGHRSAGANSWPAWETVPDPEQETSATR